MFNKIQMIFLFQFLFLQLILPTPIFCFVVKLSLFHHQN